MGPTSRSSRVCDKAAATGYGWREKENLVVVGSELDPKPDHHRRTHSVIHVCGRRFVFGESAGEASNLSLVFWNVLCCAGQTTRLLVAGPWVVHSLSSGRAPVGGGQG